MQSVSSLAHLTLCRLSDKVDGLGFLRPLQALQTLDLQWDDCPMYR